ncbi:prephenate dehydrogenase/arogenate dehydrogenase family protein [Desulfurispirillum indicum]|uniref:prephenate dehydrogenase n=1 Tax=Desulfurispirillum indicum (strain ATCC BAA-1389 / DSM 22839 / S5) TaxID=653733 RepID=E6W1T5_DESIS|nr:prephenate dehydrogenase/arogenate dehydrogenase family protein [Desulfurispirillum indicum]ADU65467.1 Prephenate dehydrogenase [Desulfurispirillum indicum S5]UCZ57387.1 prephenate dehydrogenase/arogenate dehydrogenase family protein [Desulfurispirillum indicum]
MEVIERCAIIGLGLIGGSFGAALKEHGLARHITGIDRCEQTLRQAMGSGIIDGSSTVVAGALAGCTHIFVATPVGSFDVVFEQLSQHAEASALVVDFGSVKGELSMRMHRRFPQLNYIPAHPIAGSERSGVGAASASLFRNRKWIITPLPQTPSVQLSELRQLLLAVGAVPVDMDPMEHDRVFAAVSHLPHMVAYGLVGSIAAMEDAWNLPLSRYPGAGFRDFTRIASSDETMWADIALANKAEILESMELFRESLEKIRQAIACEDRSALLESFRGAREYRDAIVRHMEEANA